MKEITELSFPEDVRYTKDHEWGKSVDGKVKVGISDYAQDQLGEIVFVELPEVGAAFEKGDEFGTLESVKAVSELYMPVGGEVVGVNSQLEDSPELVNSDPYDGGWIIEVAAGDASEMDGLMDKSTYVEELKGIKP
ncbi:MAG: glycine cleavage system protein GcvH [Desulfatiglandaceae bacterium]|jgi:glycine cleavage system H protein